MTYTYAELEVSPAAYEEIADKLKAAGYDHAFHAREDGRGYTVDMHGIGLTKADAFEQAQEVLQREPCAHPDVCTCGKCREVGVAVYGPDFAERWKQGRALPIAHANRGD
jgi:hypothetical protein